MAAIPGPPRERTPGAESHVGAAHGRDSSAVLIIAGEHSAQPALLPHPFFASSRALGATSRLEPDAGDVCAILTRPGTPGPPPSFTR
jgi:hypothetical protein